ncbi:MAG: folylpolyglutamate synthase/dihydrofolate synthase family protein [Akkermansiaceae bacterium]|nr:folylpolyglutamate synthase/dihydrofolate synthase family protein [Akkermansiaceae bacterium]
MQYREAIDWLFSTQLFGIKLGLDGPRQLLKEYLAFPDHGVKVIHVAGTNGKGSTCAMIDSVARASGSRSGLFTSPHLIDFRERIQVSGVQIPEDKCAAMLSELRAICEQLETHPTFFEITLALAMRWFREQRCELIVLETGMGGRLDATTAVPADVCVITPIGMDHQQWLGDSLEDIAREKAGIFVEGKPAVSSPQEPAARAVLEKEANQRRSPLEFIDGPLLGYTPAIPGEHQLWNAALAIEALHLAGFALNSDIIRDGLGKVSWPGRFERIRPNIILDGAHNPHAAESLVATWREQFGKQQATLIFSAVAAKDIKSVLKLLSPLASSIHFCPVDSPRATPLEELAAALPDGAPPHHIHDDLAQALQTALQSGEPILIAGSIFLIGEARARLLDEHFQASEQ